MRKAKVLVVISSLEFGGAERQVVEIVNNLDREAYEIHLCVLSDYIPLAEYINEPRTPIHVVRKRYKFDLLVVWKLYRLICNHRFDIVHSFLYDAEIASRIAASLARVPVVIGSERNSVHDDNGFKRLVARLTSPLLDACVANSTAGHEYHRNTYRLPDKKYFVVPNGVDTEKFLPRSLSPGSVGLPTEAIIIGMVGSFKRQKNHEMLLRAFARVRTRHPQVHLLFAGGVIRDGVDDSDEYGRHVQALVRELGLENVCHFLGKIENVENFYPVCRMTILPSLFEGTPNAVLESMACAVPVIATDVSDNRRVVGDGEAGYIVPLGDLDFLADCIEKLLTDDACHRALCEGARARAEEHYSIARMVENLSKVYQHLLPPVGPGS